MAKKSKPAEEQSPRKLFFFLAVGIVVATLWTIWDEAISRRPWKDYQEQFNRLELKMAREELKRARGKETRYGQLKEELARVEGALTEDSSYQGALSGLKETEIVTLEATQEYQFGKSELTEAKYWLWKAMKEGRPYQDKEAEVQRLEGEVAKLLAVSQEWEAKLNRTREEVKKFTTERDRLQKELAVDIAEIERIERKIDGLKRRAVEVKQVVIEDLDRVDRCVSCHLGVERPEFANAPQPFTTHSETIKSHPIARFGCTVCHLGQGRATTVEDSHAQVRKVRDYWIEPMYQKGFVEASCRKCHFQEDRLEYAPTYIQGRRLLLTMGCTGCHLVGGLEDAEKVGPELTRVASKVRSDWLSSWIVNPKKMNPDTRMPNFRFSEEQAKSIAAFLISEAEKWAPADRMRGPLPAKVEEGKRLFESLGCLGCHKLNGQGNSFAPALDGIGNKVKPEWLYAWLKDPKRYRADTVMPNFRLSDGGALSLTAFLSGQRARHSPYVKEPEVTPDEVGRGKALVEKYGCFGCHNIKGITKTTRIGAELSDFGDKPVDKLYFGNAFQVKETWEDWTYNKLKNPRVYTTPDSELLMPDFGFSDDQIRTLMVFLRSMTDVSMPVAWRAPYDPSAPIPRGRRLTEKLNCIGCHRIEGVGGEIAPDIGFEGEKVRLDWLFRWLKWPTEIRPILEARMPTFALGDPETAALVQYFAALVKQKLPFEPALPEIAPEVSRRGERLYFEQYGCLSCHQIGGKGGIVGPDLTRVSERLRPEWIKKWLANPQAIVPDVIMPNFGLEKDRVETLTQFLLSPKAAPPVEAKAGQ